MKGLHGGCSRSIDFWSALIKYTAMRQRLLHWLPAVLLVLCQTALLVHQADIDAHSHGENCTVCLLVHGLDNALPTPFVVHVSRPVSPVPDIVQQTAYLLQSRSFYFSRAPPSQPHPIV
jgi:hypothetical protein